MITMIGYIVVGTVFYLQGPSLALGLVTVLLVLHTLINAEG